MPNAKFKILVSFFLLFHLTGVVFAPNPSSYFYSYASRLYRYYLNPLGLASTWGFFAPEPVSPPVFIDSIVDNKNGTSISGRFPDEVDSYLFRDRQNRRMTLSRFILTNDDHIKNMFIRHLCLNKKGEIDKIRLWKTILTQPSLEDVQRGVKKITEADKYKIEVLGTYYCPETDI